MEAYDLEHGTDQSDLENQAPNQNNGFVEGSSVFSKKEPGDVDIPDAVKEEQEDEGDRHENIKLSSDAALRVRRDLLWNQGNSSCMVGLSCPFPPMV